ncbi:hypothetical protein VBD025_16190 [Virgibacillus flavescens]|uniref:hypothetical protein n=1 Tax=Virgibacillus flavescens TaxID=1611422 RepID=UPI003D335764
MKKRYVICALFILLIFLSIVTNPSKRDYINFVDFNEEKLEASFSDNVDLEVERINFLLFSTYSVIEVRTDSHSAVDLGFMGHFFRISDGQYDYPWWLELFD